MTKQDTNPVADVRPLGHLMIATVRGPRAVALATRHGQPMGGDRWGFTWASWRAFSAAVVQ